MSLLQSFPTTLASKTLHAPVCQVEHPGEIERLRHFLPSEIISSPSSAKRLQSHHFLETIPACAPSITMPAQPSFSIGLEVRLTPPLPTCCPSSLRYNSRMTCAKRASPHCPP